MLLCCESGVLLILAAVPADQVGEGDVSAGGRRALQRARRRVDAAETVDNGQRAGKVFAGSGGVCGDHHRNAGRRFPNQFLHYHRAGHGAVTSPQSKRGYTAFVHCKMSRLQGASGIHTGTMGFGKMEGESADRAIAYMLDQDVAQGPYYRQEWLGAKATTPIISGGMNALRLPGFFNNLGHSNVIQTSGGGAFGHKDGGIAGARSLRQAHEAWQKGIDLVDYAREHKELAGAFESFQADADKLYPGWRQKLGVAG